MRQTKTATFEIVVEGTEPPYVVTARGPGLDQPIRASLADRDAWLTTELRNILDIMARENITGGELPPEAIQRVGRRLFEVLFGPDIAVAFGAARAMQKDKGLRLRLEIVPPGLSALPWETMHDANGWLSTRGDTPLVRRFPAPASVLYPSSLKISPPLRILFVGASPANNTPIDIEAIAARLAGEEVLGKLIARKVVSFETLLHSTTDALLDKLAEDFHAIVFVCHGGFDETDGLQRPVIFLEDEDGDRSPLPAKGHLTDWLREKPTRLVLVAACNTAANTDETGVLLRSFAQELCETVPAVIAMQYSVSDLVAPAFVEQYLHLLAAFRPADVAIAEARQSLILPPYQAGRDVFAPVMYLQTDDGALFRKARNWTRIALLAILPLFLVLTGVTAGILRIREQELRLARKVQAEQLTAEALKVLDESPPRALLLAAQGLQVQSRQSETVSALAHTNMIEVLTKVGGRPFSEYSGIVRTVAFSPNGKWFASASADAQVRLWDAAQLSVGAIQEPIQVLELDGPVDSVVFSPDSRWLAAASRSGTAKLWNLGAGQNALGDPIVLRGEYVDNVLFSPDGKWFALWSDYGARLWKFNELLEDQASQPKELKGHDSYISALAFSPDSNWLATSSYDETTRLWNLASLHTGSAAESILLSGHDRTVNTVAFSSDSNWLISGANNLLLWNIQDLQNSPEVKPVILKGQRSTVISAAFSSNGQWLVAGLSDGTIRVWSTTHLRSNPDSLPYVLRGHTRQVSGLTFSPDNSLLISASEDHTLLKWSLAELDSDALSLPESLIGHEGWTIAMAFSPSGRWLATGGHDNMLRIWDMENPNVLPMLLKGDANPILYVTFDPFNRRLAIASMNKTAKVWDFDKLATRTGEGTPVTLEQQDWVTSVAFSHNGRFLATGSQDGSTRLYDLLNTDLRMNSVLTPTILPDHDSAVTEVAFAPSGRFLTTAAYDNEIHVWDVDDHGVILSSQPISIRLDQPSLANRFSADGNLLAVGSVDGSVRLWKATEFRAPDNKPTLLPGHVHPVEAVAFSFDNHWLATSSDDMSVRLWDLTIISQDWRTQPITLTGHTSPVYDIAFSPDNTWLASASYDATARLWNLGSLTHDQLSDSIVFHHSATVFSVVFAVSCSTSIRNQAEPCRNWIVTASEDGTLRMWLYQVYDLVNSACAHAGRNLTKDEWDKYFPGRAYDRTCPQWPVHPSVASTSSSVATATSTP